MRKPNIATVIYYLAIGCLILLTLVVVSVLIAKPYCPITSPVPQNGAPTVICIDGWSIAGVAATILAVAGTILTLIGALAVAAWWTELDVKVNKRVENRVDELFTQRVEQQVGRLLVQEAAFQELKAQVAKIDGETTRIDKEVGDLTRQSKAFQNFTFDTLLLDIPWEQLGEPNMITLSKSGLLQTSPVLAFRILSNITIKHCQIIDRLLSEASSDLHLAVKHASEDKQKDIRYWLGKSKEWQDLVISIVHGRPLSPASEEFLTFNRALSTRQKLEEKFKQECKDWDQLMAQTVKQKAVEKIESEGIQQSEDEEIQHPIADQEQKK